MGAVLYELITKAKIHDGENTFEILHSIAYKMPKMPSDLLPSIPKALEAIILKSIEKNRRKRYPTAQAMAKDIEK